MATDTADTLKSLHTSAVDAKNGYAEAVKDAEGGGLTPLFERMRELHSSHADQLSTALLAMGEKADGDGSFMSVVHRTVMDVRSLFGGLDDSALSGLIDGEKRNVNSYDEGLTTAGLSEPARSLLTDQRKQLLEAVEEMEARKRAYNAKS